MICTYCTRINLIEWMVSFLLTEMYFTRKLDQMSKYFWSISHELMANIAIFWYSKCIIYKWMSSQNVKFIEPSQKKLFIAAASKISFPEKWCHKTLLCTKEFLERSKFDSCFSIGNLICFQISHFLFKMQAFL